MRKYLNQWKAFLLAVILAVTILPVNTVSVSAAAKPVMSVKNKTVIGIDQEFSLTIKKLTKSKVKSIRWSTTNKKVAMVYDGEVISTGRGTAYIKSKITYKNGTVITPSCKVTVKIPASAIEITNAQDDISNNSRQVIAVGDTYDFNSVLIPANASNSISYSISNKDIASVDKRGIVTGKKPGFVTLTARAKLAKPADYKNGLDSILDIKDSINLEIVTKTAMVTSVDLLDTTTLQVSFDEAVDEKTLLNTDTKKLLSNITITNKSDSGVIASSLGTLTGELSSDGKKLIIHTSGYFNGLYGIKFTNNILTKDSEPLMEYYKELSLYDKTPPSYKNYTVDDTGLIASINFSEAMNYSGLKIDDVKVISKDKTAKASTISRLSTKSNYVASNDGKSLSIDLSKMSSLDQDKEFMVVFTGLRDRAGNYPDHDRITAFLATDTSPKPQAKLISLVRTDHDTLTATFTRSIDEPGEVLLSNGDLIIGVVDEENPKQVTYKLESESAKLTGRQEVNIGYWDSFNVKSSDDSADEYQEVKVEFTIVDSVPVLDDYELIVESDDGEPVYSLILTYDREVELLDDDGIFEARLVTDDGDVYRNYDIGYSAYADDEIVTVLLDSDDMDMAGSYTITIPDEFVEDDYGMTSVEETVKVDSTEGSSTALPEPRAIVQSDDDASIVYVTFRYRLDEETAEDEDNYEIEDAYIISAELIDNSSNGATVKLTLEEGSISESSRYFVTISDICGYHNTYTEMEEYTTKVYLHENRGPEIEDIEYDYPDTITITFDETIEGTASFKVMQDGKDLVEGSRIRGKEVIITLDDRPVLDESVEIVPTSYNEIKDKYGNLAELETETLTPTK